MKTERPSAETLSYHQRELEIALDASHQNHLMPAIKETHKTILDVGCGMGQTLIAARLKDDVNAYGVDLDESAIAGGQAFCGPNIHLSVGSGERLPFPDAMFDLVICRVALPYMEVAVALKEMNRVLKPGGELWLALHPLSMLKRRIGKSIRQGKVKDLVYCGFVTLNSTMLNTIGKQLVLKGKTESHQTEQGILQCLQRAGFTGKVFRSEIHFTAEAVKI